MLTALHIIQVCVVTNLRSIRPMRSYRLPTLLRPETAALTTHTAAQVTNLGREGFCMKIQGNSHLQYLDKPQEFVFTVNGSKQNLLAKAVRIDVKKNMDSELIIGFQIVSNNTVLEKALNEGPNKYPVQNKLSGGV